jgi:transposase InsO family protein
MATDSRYKIEPLDNSNYYPWKTKVALVLQNEELWGYADGSLTEPTDVAQKPGWKKNDTRTRAIITLSISNSLIIHIRGATTAAETWKAVTSHFEQKGPMGIIHALRDISTTRYDETESLEAHVKKFATFQEDLAMMEHKIEDRDFVMYLLASLPTSFDHFSTSILSSGTVPDSKILIPRLLDEESRRKRPTEHDSENTYYQSSAKGKGRVGRAGPSTRNCENCGKRGHVKANCWVPGGGKEGQGPSRKSKDKPKKQGRAHQATDNLSDSDYDSYSISHLADARNTDWIIDSGTSSHLCLDRAVFITYVPTPNTKVYGIGNHALDVKGKGTVILSVKVDRKEKELRLKNVLHTPDAKTSLLSISRLDDAGLKATFLDGKCQIRTRDGKTLAIAPVRNHLYCLEGKAVTGDASKREEANAANSHTNIEVWHRRLGHLNYRSVRDLHLKGLVKGMDLSDEPVPEAPCEGCIYGKHKRKPFPKRKGKPTRAEGPLDLVHVDIHGPYNPISPNHSKYLFLITDDHSRKSWSLFLKHKSDATVAFTIWRKAVEKETGKRLKIVRSDNGGEFKGDEFESHLKDIGVRHQTSAPKSSAQNGRAERSGRTVVEHGRSMLHQRNIPKNLWPEAIACATYLKN